MSTRFDRRTFLQAAGRLALFAGLAPAARVWASAPFPAYPFLLGVASGDPVSDGFVIWTRLAPRPLDEHAGMPMVAVPVRWEVAEDEAFATVVRRGEAIARPELGHSIHVDVQGLRPRRPYWYRFHVTGQPPSPVGTVRTAPAAADSPERIRIGVAGCQHHEAGLFTAYRHLSREQDLDAVFHYGDYIYEGAGKEGALSFVDTHGRRVERSHVGGEIYTLDDYRRRYAQYKSDPDLQAAHAATAFLSTWDDHEFDNNWAAALDQDGTPPEVFALRKLAAMQAWYENMPVRRALFPTPQGGITLYRRLDYGRTLRVHLLDTRQYRSKQRCERGTTRPCRTDALAGPEHMLGSAQEQWLGAGLDSGVRWHLLAQQVMVMPYAYPDSRKSGPTNTDSWSGYPAARARLVDTLRERGWGNVVVATGDVHKHHAGVIPSVDGDLLSTPVATEFVTTSIASGGDGSDIPSGWEHVPSENPHTHLLNDRRGYQVFDIGPRLWRTEVIGVDKVSAPGGTKTVIARLAVEHGKPGIQPA